MPKPSEGGPWYTRDEARRALGIGMSTLERALRNGEIYARRPGNGWRVYIHESELERYRLHHQRGIDWQQQQQIPAMDVVPLSALQMADALAIVEGGEHSGR